MELRFFRRSLYLLYYLKETDYRQLGVFIRYVSRKTGVSGWKIMADAVYCVFKYNVSLKDYFCFGFFGLNGTERRAWAGSGFMYEYQLQMNPKGVRDLLEDKIRFLRHYKSFLNRKFASLEELKKDVHFTQTLLSNASGRLVLKGSHGQVGAEVEVISCRDHTPAGLIRYMTGKNYDLAEEYVIQHPALMNLSPTGLNTIRIFTQLQEGSVDFIGARLRVTVNSMVDNMAAGNLAAPVDLQTGVVNGPGVYSDITKEDQHVHPVTGKAITGFKIPHWEKVIGLARTAALHMPVNKSVGWDIAVTEDGTELIEGNHNWCRLLWQMPVRQGLKQVLEQYISWKKS